MNLPIETLPIYPPDFPGRRNVTVSAQAGRQKGWPANGGLWIWGNEIVALYEDVTFNIANPRDHTIDRAEPGYHEQARSLDGGETWTIEPRALDYPSTMTKFWTGKTAASDLATPLDFAAPNSALLFKMTHHEEGPSYFFYTDDRARTWQGPFCLPMFGLETVNARECVLINGSHDLMAFVSGGAQANHREDGYYTFMIRTRDGGVTWGQPVRTCRETPPFGEKTNSVIMPSAVRIGPREIVCLTRNTDSREPAHWIETWASEDDGATFERRGSRIYTGNSSTPPAVLRLLSGRLIVTYGYRAVPYGIRARASDDGGATWGREIILRQDGGNFDLGYTRNVLRSDGQIVTVYYFNDDLTKERRIEATIWNPETIGAIHVTY